MAGRFEAPKGSEGYIPEYTDARPGKKAKGRKTPETKADKKKTALTKAEKPKPEVGKAKSNSQPTKADSESPKPQADKTTSQPQTESTGKLAAISEKLQKLSAPVLAKLHKKEKTAPAEHAPKSDSEAVKVFHPRFVREEKPQTEEQPQTKDTLTKLYAKLKIQSPVKVLSVMTAVLAVMFVALSIQAFRLTAGGKLPTGQESISMEATLPPVELEPVETTAPVATYVVQTSTVGILGDFFMNKYITDSVYSKESDHYDFSDILRYLKSTVDDYDYCVASLETTLGGKEHPYQGSPNANSPDELIDNLYDAGVKMLVTSNEHCYDTGADGFRRTLEVLAEKNVRSLGTVSAKGESPYQVVDLGGIRVGFLAYTYEDSDGTTVPTWGSRKMPEDGYDLVSSFPKKSPDLRFEEISHYQQEMRNAGADLTVIYLHWGTMYTTEANGNQKAFAQQLCNMGFDVIVGSHPHMVQPMSLLQSEEDALHHTICVYSLGNALSNQRQGTLNEVKTAHTEDGAMLTVTLEKYSDGAVYLAAVNVIPLWVRLNVSAVREYSILPLDGKRENDWKVSLDLTETSLNTCQKSYKRTMDILGEGLTDCRSFLEEQKENRNTAYFNQSVGESEAELIP